MTDDNKKDSVLQKHKTVNILVNTRPFEWNEKDISYVQLVELAFGLYIENETVSYTVTYVRGEKPKTEGSMVKGSIVKVKEGMIFNVTQTNRS